MAWLFLVVAGLFEIGWAVGLKYTDGFTRLWATLGTVASMIISLGLLGLALRTLPLGTAYAIWTGVGTVGTALLGIALHFTVAACIVTTYWVLSRWIPVMRRRVALPGLLFGAAAFFVMNLVVVPLTRIGRQPLVWSPFLIGALLLHVFLLGPAAAYFVARVRS